MKKRSLLGIAAICVILDILAVVLYWCKYSYNWNVLDGEIAAGIAFVCLLACVATGIVMNLKVCSNIFITLCIIASVVFIGATVGCYIYNESARVTLENDEIAEVVNGDKKYSDEQIEQIITEFNSGKYVKRFDPDGYPYPDEKTCIRLSNGNVVTVVVGDSEYVDVEYSADKTYSYMMKCPDLVQLLK